MGCDERSPCLTTTKDLETITQTTAKGNTMIRENVTAITVPKRIFELYPPSDGYDYRYFELYECTAEWANRIGKCEYECGDGVYKCDADAIDYLVNICGETPLWFDALDCNDAVADMLADGIVIIPA